MRRLDEGAQIVNGPQAKLSDDWCEAAFEEVMLILLKHDARVRIDMLAEKLVVLRIDYPA
jgi:hypothetical protein